MLIEGQCDWMRITGRATNQSNNNGLTNFKLDSTTWQIGGQAAIAPGWFLGGSLAYENSWLSSADGVTSGNGQAGYGAVTLKYQTGPWLFSAAAFGGAGQFNTSRIISLPGFASVAKGNPDMSNVGFLLRAAYTTGSEKFYLRPNVTLSTVHVRTGAYTEGGAGPLSLAVNSAAQNDAILTPMVEVGGRVALGSGMLLRPYVSAGLSVQTDGSWTQSGHLVSAPAGAAGFTTSVPMGHVFGRVAAGAQLYSDGPLSLRLQYDGEFSGIVTSHAGSLIGSLRF
jgi:outer membrane autotransporter protein